MLGDEEKAGAFYGSEYVKKHYITHFSLLEDDCGANGFPFTSNGDRLALALMGLNWTCQWISKHKGISLHHRAKGVHEFPRIVALTKVVQMQIMGLY